MDFSLTDEQRLLRDSVARFVAGDHDFQKLRTQPADDGLRSGYWQTFTELGWLALAVPEEEGGLGATLEDAALVFEELGKGLVDAPLLSQAILPAFVIAQGRDFAGRSDLLAGIAGGERRVALALEESASRYDPAVVATALEADSAGGMRLRGRKIVVQDGASADSFLVSTRLPGDGGNGPIALVLVPADAEGVEVRRYRLIDGRHAADVGFDNVRLSRDSIVVPADDALSVLRETVNRASVLLAAEALGVMEAAMEITASYLRTRQQFKRPLSDFQVLTHRLAEMFVKVENSRSMVLRGLSAMTGPVDERDAAISATMVAVIQAGEFIGANSVQLHGGVGMADENVIGHHYKRLRAIGKSYGDLHFHMNRYMRSLRN